MMGAVMTPVGIPAAKEREWSNASLQRCCSRLHDAREFSVERRSKKPRRVPPRPSVRNIDIARDRADFVTMRPVLKSDITFRMERVTCHSFDGLIGQYSSHGDDLRLV